MKKQLLTVLSLLVMLTAILSACGGNNSGNTGEKNGETNTKTDGTATKLEFWTFNELHQTFYEDMAKRWNEVNPDQKIQLAANTYPYDDMHNKLLVALQSGTGAPDITDIELNKFPNFLKGEPQLLPLNDVVEPELNNLVQSRMDIYAKDGQYYGIDFHVGAAVIYYNKEILDKAGVNADDIKTWADYEAAGKKVLDATGVPMTTLETADLWSLWPQVSQAPGNDDFQTADGQVNITSPLVLEPLKWQQNLLKSGIAIPAPGGNHHKEEYYGLMNSGGAASLWMPMWYMGRFTDYMPDLKGKIIIKPMPAWKAGEPRSAGMGGTGTAVTKTTKHPELAKAFLAFAKLSKEGNIEIWKQLGFDPIRSDVWTDPALSESNKFTEYFGPDIFDVLNEVKEEIEGVNINETTPMISDAFRTSVLVRILLDNEDPEKVLKEAAGQLK
ncbi:extracellular solute-binding protein [Paenibacillus alkaliterrae]|uniref:ABC transporter substrate-binding protein n=1 Tax=Paenibacillus alkaliterrae TaxID=320909 RepID=UPI001F264457|nr:extracellular solute-binding protein [Paenibacillus alkaliterrae]MCF2940488.1 extracellular solute-binding protein [Paenibacillus alkaliterrae]